MVLSDFIILMENYFLIKTLELLVSKVNFRNLSSLFMIFLLTFESFVLTYFGIDQVLRLVVPVITLLLYSQKLKQSFLSNILMIFISFLNLSFIHAVVIMVSSLFIGDSFFNYISNYYFMFFLSCLAITIQGVQYFFIKNHFKTSYKLSPYSIFVSVLSSVISLISINVILKYYVLELIPYYLCFGLILVFIVLLFLIMSLCLSNTKYYESNLDQALRLEALQYQDEVVDLINKKTAEYNKLRHDINNHLMIINELLKHNHTKETYDYVSEIHFDEDKELININHLVLKYLLNNKVCQARDMGINVSCIVFGVPCQFISDIDYSILVGNLLDNAIEGAVRVKSPKIEIVMHFHDFKFIIEVKNSVESQIKTNYLSTRKKRKDLHGIGLKNIKNIVDKYQGQDVIEVNNNEFYHICILYEVKEL